MFAGTFQTATRFSFHLIGTAGRQILVTTAVQAIITDLVKHTVVQAIPEQWVRTAMDPPCITTKVT